MESENSMPGLKRFATTFGLTVQQDQEKPVTNGSANGSTDDDLIIVKDTAVKDTASSVPKSSLAPTGSLSTAKNIYAGKEDDQGRYTWIDEEPEDIEEAAENAITAQYALVVRNKKCFDSRKKLEIHSIVVQSPWLKKALAQILQGYPGVTCELERLVFDAPFEPFVHRWGELLQFRKRWTGGAATGSDAATRDHVDLLYEILKEELKDTIKAFEDYVAHGVITYEHLWTIFQPGAVIVSKHGGTLSAYELQEAVGYQKTRCGNAYVLSVENIDWSGDHFGRGTDSINLYQFRGTKKIKDLLAMPLTFYPEKEALKARLIQRGKKFEELAGYHYKAYKGPAISWDNDGNEIRVNVEGRIVIDTFSFNKFSYFHIRYLEELREHDDVTVIENGADSDDEDNDFLINKRRAKVHLGEAQHLICMARVRGYSLKSKQWLDFWVDLVKDITWNDNAFNGLVLPADQKELIMSFAEAQVQNRQTFDDVIQGKGKGIILLLSGPPGVGKTLTAESVAENMRVPLYLMSAGELGLRPDDVENNLSRILETVAKWNAVLLLDECDVFLEARSTNDLERNKLVSIFLRTLEYYEGILFLTTNRVDNIDTAFQSRIHVSLAYSELNAESRRIVWKNFLEMSKQPHDLNEKDLDDLANISLNGRQIKNVLKAGQLLVMKKGGNLRRELVDTVLAIEKRRP